MRSLPLLLGSAIALACAFACSDSSGGDGGNGGSGSGNGNGGSTSGNNVGGTASATGGQVGLGTATGGSSTTSGTGESCAAETAKAERRPVILAFAFDVSGSMGKLDKPYHDPELKWKPVVSATEAFFADPKSVGISASLNFFPGPDSDTKCDASTYATPDVPLTGLPSTAFADAITAITPKSSDEWRGSTPTLAVLKGVYGQLAQVAVDHPDANIAVVLVTDGYPQGCDDNAIASVEAEVALHPTMRTYVIGVENPPNLGAPDTVSNLNSVAVAGGTESAFLIQTADPTATSAQLSSVIDTIRGNSVSCELTIPPAPTGETLDKSKVNVTYTSGSTKTPFVYDPECKVGSAWHYNDPNSPTTVVLCPNDCTTVMADATASVDIEFGCKQRTTIIQ